MSAVYINRNNFKEEVLSSDKPVLLDFWAPWCGPCRMVSPIIEELAQEYDGKIKVCKVNVDEESALASQNAIVSIPTVILFANGKPVEKMVGAHSFDDYADVIDMYI